MNEEEKQAIEELEDLHRGDYFCDVILNLIDKQQKEIDKCEYYKDHADLFLEENKKLKKEIEALKIIHEAYKEQIQDIEKRYISKDKIKEKIKKLEEKWEKCPSENYEELDEIRIEKETLETLLKE